MTAIRRRTLHILISSTFPSYSGGREAWLYHVLTHLDAGGCSVVLYSIRSNAGTPFFDLSALHRLRHVAIPDIPRVWRLLLPRDSWLFKLAANLDLLLAFPRRAAACLERQVQDDDIVLCMNPVVDLEPGIRLRQRGRRFTLVCGVHGTVADELSRSVPMMRPYLTHLERSSLLQADIVLANGYDTREYLKQLGVESQVIPNGADLAPFMNPLHLGDAGLDFIRQLRREGTYVIGVVGSLRPIKGTHEVLESIARLAGMTTMPFKAVFVGKGDLPTYRSLARALAIEEHILFAGEQANVPGLVHYFDLAVCPSYGSGMSVAARECMAAGRPVVAWDSPIYRQMIRHGTDGWLVTERDSGALARGILYAMEHPAEAASWGRAAQSASLGFDWSAVTADLVRALSLDCEADPRG